MHTLIVHVQCCCSVYPHGRSVTLRRESCIPRTPTSGPAGPHERCLIAPSPSRWPDRRSDPQLERIMLLPCWRSSLCPRCFPLYKLCFTSPAASPGCRSALAPSVIMPCRFSSSTISCSWPNASAYGMPSRNALVASIQRPFPP